MSLVNSSLATIKTRIEKGDLIPYYGADSSDVFLKALSSYSGLKESLDKQLESNTDWVAAADNNQIFFIFDNYRWKRPNSFPFEPKLQLKLIGPEKVPTISIDV